MDIILFIKGLIVGFAKIIPGVSGAMLAITMGIYDKGISVISNFFSDVKDNIKFTLNVGLGIILAIIFGSKIVVFLLDNHYLPTMLLFIGLIVGGIPSFVNSIDRLSIKKYYTYTVFSFLLTLMFLFMDNKNIAIVNNFDFTFYFTMFLIGIVDAATMIIPGVSGTAILMLLGYYDIIMDAFSNMANINLLGNNLNILIPFGLGIIVGVIILAKIINYFLENHRDKMYMIILGLSLSSICLLFLKTVNNNYKPLEIIISLIMLVIGYNVSKKFS